jgi:hypothetical protein
LVEVKFMKELVAEKDARLAEKDAWVLAEKDVLHGWKGCSSLTSRGYHRVQ